MPKDKTLILNQCVSIIDDIGTDCVSEKFVWCKYNIGDQQVHPLSKNHPDKQIKKKGKWALFFDRENSRILFWFKDIEDKTLFALTWC
jgi:hypothetical protein